MTMRITRKWLLWGLLAATCAMRAQHVGAAPNCADLTRPGLFPNTIVQTAAVVAADAKTGMPAYCEVTALITPVVGSKITAVYRLPESWNGRMLGLGGGGWAGILALLQPAACWANRSSPVITVAPRRRTTTRHAPLADAWA